MAIIIAIIAILGAVFCILTGLWIAKTLKAPNNPAAEYLQMQDLIASSPIVQPSSAASFHESIDSRTNDWEQQIEKGRLLSGVPHQSSLRERPSNFGPNIPAKITFKKPPLTNFAARDVSDTKHLADSDVLEMESSNSDHAGGLDWDPSYDVGQADKAEQESTSL